MREILFRGKLHSGTWAFGNLDIGFRGVAFITPDETPLGSYGQVAPETVGQYTGLVDKHGQKIFEDDLVAVTLPATIAQPEFSWGVCKVIFAEGCFGVLTSREFIPFRSFAPRVEFEVAGNIFDKEENCNA